MGILDFPAPMFQFLDGVLAFLPGGVRLVLWSVLAGVLSMGLYALLSPQTKIAAAKKALSDTRGLLVEADESFAELMQLVKKSLGLSFKHLALVLGPALLAALPLICTMAWVSNHFGHQLPQPGIVTSINVEPAVSAPTLSLKDGGLVSIEPDSATWQFAWPGPGENLVLADSNGAPLFDLPPTAAIPVVHKRQWWNSLLGNPAGYLPSQGSVELLHVNIPAKQYLPFGPEWARSWLTLFLLASVVGALITKRIFKIH